MKKLICILFSFTVLIASLFADKSCFYENGKVIDTMYVDSEDGLKVRDYPSLKSNRLCGLPNRIQVKVIAIGKEETIDGITAPWVEILIPRYEWKGDEAEFGWVFGGYLCNSRNLKHDLPLELRLQVKNWKYTTGNCESCSIDFCEEGFNSKTFRFFYQIRGLDATPIAVEYKGKWNVKGETIFFEGTHSFGNFEPESDRKILKTQLDNISGYDWLVFEPFPLVTSCDVLMDYGYRSVLSQEHMESIIDDKVQFFSSYFNEDDTINFSKPYIYYEVWSDFGDERDSFYNPLMMVSADFAKKKYTIFVQPLIEAGVDPRGSDYIKQYHDYWNPIMAEHQKKADAMK